MSSSSTPAVNCNDNAGMGVLIAAWFPIALSTITTALRLYTRIFLRSVAGWDDFCMAIATAIAITNGVFVTLTVHYGFGRHIECLAPAARAASAHWLTGAELQSFCALFFLRTSICFFLLRLISKTRRNVRYLIYVFMFLNFAVTAVIVISYGVQCVPFSNVWEQLDHTIKDPHCFSRETLTVTTRLFGAFGIVCDFMCVLLPLLILKSLQMDTKTKIGMSIIMGLGVLTAACSIGKTVTANLNSLDETWSLVPIMIWALCELNFGMVVASIPALRQLVSVARQNATKKSTAGGTHDSYYGHGAATLAADRRRSSALRDLKFSTTIDEDESSFEGNSRDATITKTTEIQVELSHRSNDSKPDDAERNWYHFDDQMEQGMGPGVAHGSNSNSSHENHAY